MGSVPYDPQHIAAYFDEYGTREWERFDATPMDRAGLEVHLRLLRSTSVQGAACWTRVQYQGGSHSSSPLLSVQNDSWDDRFLDVEVAACSEPGALDGGTHIDAVLERLGR
jgi:hypothetical protein